MTGPARPLNRPAPDEFAGFYAGYVALVPHGVDPRDVLAQQVDTLPALLATVSETRAGFRYAPEKWSIRQVAGHLSDAERVLSYRLLRVARNDATPLAGFEENDYAQVAGSDAQSLADLVAEWVTVRHATLTLVRSLDGAAWERRGVANGASISARALAFIIPGHVQHHVNVLRDRYGVGRAP